MNSCEGCAFLHKNNCDLGLFPTIKSKYNYHETNNGLVFDGKCFSFRGQEWIDTDDLKTKFYNETKIRPAIFVPVNSLQQVIDLKNNYQELIDDALYLNIIDYTESNLEDIISIFPYAKITKTITDPNSSILTNLKTINTNGPLVHLMVIDDTSKKPTPNLYQKFWDRINVKFDPCVTVIGDGYYFMIAALYVEIVYHFNIFEWIKSELEKNTNYVIKDSNL